MGCFGGGSAASAQREADHLALISKYKSEVTTLKGDVTRLEREMVELKAKSSNRVREVEEEAKLARREADALRSQLDRANDTEGEVAEHTVSLIKEISELKSRLRSGGGGGGAEAGNNNDSEEVLRLKRQLEEAKEEARTYSEEIGDLAKQVSELQAKQEEAASYRKEIKHLRSKLGDDVSDCSGASAASGLFGFQGDLLGMSGGGSASGTSSGNSSTKSTPMKLAHGTFQIDAKNVIQTVSLTSGFFGSVSDGSITLSKAEEASRASAQASLTSRSGTATPTGKASVVTPTGRGLSSKKSGGVSNNATHIDTEVVSNAIKCVEDLIKRVNQSRSKGLSSFSTTPTKKDLFKSGGRVRSFEEENIEVFDLPASMRGTFEDDDGDCSTSAVLSIGTSGKREEQESNAQTTDNSEQNSSFYSAASTKEAIECSSTNVVSPSKSPVPSSGTSAILDTSSWKPVGTTGELLAVSDGESTIGTLDGGDYLDDTSSCHSAYSAPVALSRKGRNESAVIIADLYRVQTLLSSVLEGRPHVKEQLQSSLMPHNLMRAGSSFSAGTATGR